MDRFVNNSDDQRRGDALLAERAAGFWVGWDQGYAYAMDADWGDAKRTAWDYDRGFKDGQAAASKCSCIDTSTECEDTVTHKALCPCRGQECFLISERTGRCVSCLCGQFFRRIASFVSRTMRKVH